MSSVGASSEQKVPSMMNHHHNNNGCVPGTHEHHCHQATTHPEEQKSEKKPSTSSSPPNQNSLDMARGEHNSNNKHSPHPNNTTDVLLRAASTLENHPATRMVGSLMSESEFVNNEKRKMDGMLNDGKLKSHIPLPGTASSQLNQQPKKRKLSNSSSQEATSSMHSEETASASSESYKRNTSVAITSNKKKTFSKPSAIIPKEAAARVKRSNKVVRYTEYEDVDEEEDFEEVDSTTSLSEYNTNSNEYLSESSGEELRHKKPKSKKKASKKEDSEFTMKKEKKGSAKKSSANGKIYDSVKGTTCHQCKQKTMDQKSSCQTCLSSPMSSSTNRGSFCASCLKNRYGEELSEVLDNPEWKCPICRGVCNCSNCRRKAGKNPISITTREALKSGYHSVHEMILEKFGD